MMLPHSERELKKYDDTIVTHVLIRRSKIIGICSFPLRQTQEKLELTFILTMIIIRATLGVTSGVECVQ